MTSKMVDLNLERSLLCSRIGELEAENEQLRTTLETLPRTLYGYQAEIERLRNLLAECFPLVRPTTDLSRRMREALGRDKGGSGSSLK